MSRVIDGAPYTILLPPGWVRFPVDDTTDETLAALIDGVVRQAPAERRGAVHEMLSDAVRGSLAAARSKNAIDLIVSLGEVGGLPVPASIVAFPLEAPQDGRSAEETLVGLARAGTRAIEIDGLPAIRRVVDSAGDESAPAHRAVNYIVHVPWQSRWLLFTASILSSDDPGYREVGEALEALMDAMVSTVRFTKEPAHS